VNNLLDAIERKLAEDEVKCNFKHQTFVRLVDCKPELSGTVKFERYEPLRESK
jgi:hypothetical protein